ncbi:MAG: tyrosine-type recombinase/integrase [Alphaproteobacteria bacterium]
MTNKSHNFTKAYLNALAPAPTGKRYMVYDTVRPELAIRITDKGTKSFLIQKRINNQVVKITLGKYPAMSIPQARDAVIKELNKLTDGINPNEEKKNIRQEISLGELFEEYMERYSRRYKKSWEYDARETPKFMSHWFNRRISTITRQEIQKLHEEIRDKNGLYQANRILERLKAMYNKAIEWGYQGINPASRIKKFKEVKRDRFLLPDELPRFFEAIDKHPNQQVKDFLHLALLTGARKTELLTMRWADIDFTNKIWRIPETKNDTPHIVTLTAQSIEILKRLKAETTGQWTFPSLTSKSGHLEDPKRAFKAICKAAEIEDLRIHDLRRTFASYQAIQGTSMLIIGKSVGHKDMKSTEIYSRLSQDPIRESVDKATNRIWELGHGE